MSERAVEILELFAEAQSLGRRPRARLVSEYGPARWPWPQTLTAREARERELAIAFFGRSRALHPDWPCWRHQKAWHAEIDRRLRLDRPRLVIEVCPIERATCHACGADIERRQGVSWWTHLGGPCMGRRR